MKTLSAMLPATLIKCLTKSTTICPDKILSPTTIIIFHAVPNTARSLIIMCVYPLYIVCPSIVCQIRAISTMIRQTDTLLNGFQQFPNFVFAKPGRLSYVAQTWQVTSLYQKVTCLYDYVSFGHLILCEGHLVRQYVLIVVT